MTIDVRYNNANSSKVTIRKIIDDFESFVERCEDGCRWYGLDVTYTLAFCNSACTEEPKHLYRFNAFSNNGSVQYSFQLQPDDTIETKCRSIQVNSIAFESYEDAFEYVEEELKDAISIMKGNRRKDLL